MPSNICNRYVWPLYSLVNVVIDHKSNQMQVLTEYFTIININPKLIITMFGLGVEQFKCCTSIFKLNIFVNRSKVGQSYFMNIPQILNLHVCKCFYTNFITMEKNEFCLHENVALSAYKFEKG